MHHTPIAVCALIMNHYGEALLVSRRNDPNAWGMPGGKVDPGETALDAVIREVKEETGISMDIDHIVPLHQAVCKGDVTYDVITYFYDCPAPELEFCKAEDGMSLKFGDFTEIMEENSPFAEYNRGVYISLGEAFSSTND